MNNLTLDQIIANTENAQDLITEKVTVKSVKNMIENSANFDENHNTGFDQKVLDLFTVKSVPVSSPFGLIDGQNALYTLDENEQPVKCVNGKVSNNYKIHQPIDVIKAFEKAANNCHLTINKVLTNKYTGGLLINAEYGNCKIVGEDHNAQINFYTAHNGVRKTFASVDFLRMACFNQIPTLFSNEERHILSEKHYTSLCLDKLQEKIEQVPETIRLKNERSEQLLDTPLSLDDFIDLWVEKEKLKTEQKSYDRKVTDMRNTYLTSDGQDGIQGTAYGAFQAITYENTHGKQRASQNKVENDIKRSNDSLVFEEILLNI